MQPFLDSLPETHASEFDSPTTSYLNQATSPLATLSDEEATHALSMIENKINTCQRCQGLAGARQKTVFGSGNPQPELFFIGEAPGANEDIQGLPFVGRAGQLLDRIIEACGMRRDEVYIGNVLKCRPPENRRPLPAEVAGCLPYLDLQVALLKPKLICTLGATAAQSLFNTADSMRSLRGRIYDYKNIPVICTYHPAYLLRNPEKKREVWDDMKRVMNHLGRPLPENG